MKIKHTPGPWTVTDNTTQGVGHQLRVDSNDGAIADCGRNPFVDDEMRANARLIAATPELLEACKAAMLWAKTPGNHGGNPYCHNFMGLIEAAIAKAEGAIK